MKSPFLTIIYMTLTGFIIKEKFPRIIILNEIEILKKMHESQYIAIEQGLSYRDAIHESIVIGKLASEYRISFIGFEKSIRELREEIIDYITYPLPIVGYIFHIFFNIAEIGWNQYSHIEDLLKSYSIISRKSALENNISILSSRIIADIGNTTLGHIGVFIYVIFFFWMGKKIVVYFRRM